VLHRAIDHRMIGCDVAIPNTIMYHQTVTVALAPPRAGR
jgi:hypothetical protein